MNLQDLLRNPLLATQLPIIDFPVFSISPVPRRSKKRQFRIFIMLLIGTELARPISKLDTYFPTHKFI